MQEQIGKVILDLDKYPGEDIYSDGAVEDRLLNFVQNSGEESMYDNWAYLYHLSPVRENIVKWLPISKNDKVLEVGSGCGAITGALLNMAGSVECVDLSRKRSTINASRNRDADNLMIHVGNFKDIEPDLSCDFDYVLLIGVFEYAVGYMGCDNPYAAFVNILKKHLKEGGRLVIAIENKIGIKYLAGAREDHSGIFFDGINNYRSNSYAHTFTKGEIANIFKSCGIDDFKFFYPYPDYKLAGTIYSDEKLPSAGELNENRRNFDRDRFVLFDEGAAYEWVLSSGLFGELSNSFIVVTGPGFEGRATDYTNEDSYREFALKSAELLKPAFTIEDAARAAGAVLPKIQIYFNDGKGYREDYSVRIENFKRNGKEISFDIEVPQGVSFIRIDPADSPCMVSVEKTIANGVDITGEVYRKYLTGKTFSGRMISSRVMAFADSDPYFELKLKGLNAGADRITLNITLRIDYIDDSLATNLKK